MKVLLIEDDLKLKEYTREYLEAYDFKVTTIEDFNNVMNIVEDTKPNLIILDINLPTFDGFYYLRLIRRKYKTPDINKLDNSYWNDGNLWGGKISDDERGTIEAYRPIFKEELIRMQIDNNGMVLFTMIFIGLLFVISNGVVLYYKVFSDIKEEEERIKSLNRIGILDSEIKTMIRKELAITFFTPIIIGGSLGLYFLYVMVSNSGITGLLVGKSLIVLLIGFIIQVILYSISLRKYFKEVVYK